MAGSIEDVRNAIMQGASQDEIEGLELPDKVKAAFVRKDEQDMFQGMASADKDPRKSLHVDEVDLPPLGPNECLVGVMASAINFNTVWTSIFEPLSTFKFLERFGRESELAKRHDLDYHIVGSDASGVVLRVGSAVRKWKPGDRSPSTAITWTTRTRRLMTTRCWPPTSASGGSRRTSAGSPT